MFDSKNQSYVAQLFADYRTENNHLLTKFGNIKSYLEKLSKLGSFEKKEIVGGLFSLNSHLGPAFDSIMINLSKIIEIVDALIICLEKEKKELDNYMSNLKNATTKSQSQLETLLLNYNNEQYDYMQQLNTLIPNVIELFERAIGMEDQTIEDNADKIKNTYLQLESALLNENIDKDSLYLIFEEVLFKLRDNINYLADILKHLKGNPKKFIENFRVIKSLLTEFEKHRVNCGRDKDKDKLFTDLDSDEKKVKLDEFMKSKLEALFHKIQIGKGDDKKDAKHYIEKIIENNSF